MMMIRMRVPMPMYMSASIPARCRVQARLRHLRLLLRRILPRAGRGAFDPLAVTVRRRRARALDHVREVQPRDVRSGAAGHDVELAVARVDAVIADTAADDVAR